jgi:RNA polymerase sigma-B factor
MAVTAQPTKRRPARPPAKRRKELRGRDAEVERLFAAYRRTGDCAAREALVRRFMPLARRLAARYRGGSEELEDLVQVASLALIKAIDRFDPARDVAFTSFAVPTIAGELKRHFRDKSWAVRVPRDLQERALRVGRAAERLEARLGRSPTAAELSAAMRVPVEQVIEAREAMSGLRADSLDRPLADGEPAGESHVDLLGAPDGEYERVEARATLARYLKLLPARERTVLVLRFHEGLTQTEIAKRVGCSQMHVSRLIRASLQRLRILAGDVD